MKTLKKLLYPHIALMLVLLPVSIGLLVWSLSSLESSSPVAVASYCLSAYTLTVWCLRVPNIITFFKNFANTNAFIVRWRSDVRFRVNLSLFGSMSWNAAYAIFQLWLGIYHSAVWYYSAAAYYFLLAGMRFFLVRFSSNNEPGEKMREELRRFRACGWTLLMLNLALAVMIALNVWDARVVHHHEITAIAMATYTFTSFTVAIVNLFRYRKYNSPIFMASKSISFATASVSMLSLSSTMLSVFDETHDLTLRRFTTGFLGGGVSLLFIGMSVYMIISSTKKLRIEDGKIN
ncbi:MAG: hypothetical protein ACI3XI_05065 [Eubacteriales bacterium]